MDGIALGQQALDHVYLKLRQLVAVYKTKARNNEILIVDEEALLERLNFFGRRAIVDFREMWNYVDMVIPRKLIPEPAVVDDDLRALVDHSMRHGKRSDVASKQRY